MKARALAAYLMLTIHGSAADGSRVEYVGGTVSGLPERTGGRVRTTDGEFFVLDAHHNRVTIPYSRINLLEYGQKVDRRYLVAVLVSPLFMLSKARQHYLTVGYTDDDGKQQALVLKVDKGDIRTVLVTLEARTGLRVQFQDEEARKAGKG